VATPSSDALFVCGLIRAESGFRRAIVGGGGSSVGDTSE
jgi:hypothetical protein